MSAGRSTLLRQPPVPPLAAEGFDLSPSQRRLWSLLDGGLGGGLRTRGVVEIDPPVDPARLARAFDRLAAGHEVLRTRLVAVAGLAEPLQVIDPRGRIPLAHADLQRCPPARREAALAALEESLRAYPLDPHCGPGLAAITVTTGDAQLLLVEASAAVLDGPSLGNLVEVLAAACSGPVADPGLLQYADVAAWHNELAASQRALAARFWRGLELAPLLRADGNGALPPGAAERAPGTVRTVLTTGERERLRALAEEAGCELPDVLLAAWGLLLRRHLGTGALAVGVLAEARGPDELAKALGPFARELPVPFREPGATHADAWLRTVAEVRDDIEAWADVFEPGLLVEEGERPGDLPYGFAWHALPAPCRAGGVRLALRRLETRPEPHELELACTDSPEGLRLAVRHDRCRVPALLARRLAGRLRRLLDDLVARPGARVEDLDVLTPAERTLLLHEVGDGATTAPPAAHLVELLALAQGRHPERIAVQFRDRHLTYGALDAECGRLARFLIQAGVGPEVPVAVCLDRSIELPLALLAILRAGGAYVPLDPEDPPERRRFVLEDAGAPLVLTTSALAAELDGTGARVVRLDRDREDFERAAARPAAALAPGNLAYVIYTSGSTGRPKGAANTHAGITNRLWWMQQEYRLGEDDRVLQKTPFGFDVSVWELFWPLAAGARLVMAEPGGHRDAGYLVRVATEARITTLHFVPSMMQVFLEEPAVDAIASLVRVVASGEALPAATVRLFYDRLGDPLGPAGRARLHNLYGPTEAAVDVTFHPCSPTAAATATVPIGRPVANTRIRLLDRGLRLVPPGVAGELAIGGVQLARGYWGRPALTAERFVPDPEPGAPGERLYRTGDLCRHREDGAVEFLGRIDHQVKLRGVRIELGEVEAALARHPAVAAAVAAVRETEAGEPGLVAYFVARPDADPGEDELGAALERALPAAMVPGAFVRLAELPRLPNGKIDRRRLPAPGRTTSVPGAAAAPRTASEELLLALWRGLMGRTAVGLHDDFFRLGGHSLMATRLISRVRSAFAVDLDLETVFEARTVAAQARAIDERRRRGADQPLEPLVRSPRDSPLPLSFAQRRLWFIDQLQPGSSAYNLGSALRWRGPVDLEALRRTRDEIVRRHESLRTRFAVEEDGTPVQVIAPARPRPLETVDLGRLPEALREREMRRLVAVEARRPFDLERGPLMRSAVVRMDGTDHVVMMTVHHIVSDGWSQSILVREVGEVYQALVRGRRPDLPELPIQYADFAQWQRRWLRGEVLERQLAFWRRQLGGAAVLELPTDRPRPATQTFSGSVRQTTVPADVTARLEKVALEHQATLFMTLLAAFHTLLHRHTGQTDVSVGTPIANRGHVELEGLVGFFANTLALRLDLSGDPSFADLLVQVRRVALACSSHQDLPFEQLVEALQPERALDHQPLFQVMFVLEAEEEERLALPGFEIGAVESRGTTAKFDLTLFLRHRPNGLLALAEYNTDLFDATTVDRLLGHLRNLLAGITAGPDRRLGAYDLLDPAERHQVLSEWNDTERPAEPPPGAATLPDLFRARVRATPEAVAVYGAREAWSWAALADRADRLAAHLGALGVEPGDAVGVALDRSPRMVWALLGILQAGATYVPLSASFPPARKRWILEALGSPCAVADGDGLAQLARIAGDLPRFRHLVDLGPGGSGAAPEGAAPAAAPAGAGADAVAYVVFTSGSTGEPKGVVVRHRPVLNLIAWVNEGFGLGPSDRVLFTTSLSFDLSVYDLFGVLAAGGSVRVATEDELAEPGALVEVLRREPITFWDSAPAALQQLVPFFPEPEAGPGAPALRLVFLSGDWIPVDLPGRVTRAFAGARVIALGGATEATVWSNYHPVRAVPPHWVSIPYGRPITNARYHVLHPRLDPAPVGVAGDLFIGGEVLAAGYSAAPSLTAGRFIPDPFAGAPGARLYRTGDRARYWPDGELQFLGRVDHQVKIRGYRIELGEVESVLRDHPSLRDAVALVREPVPGDRRLVAFGIPETGALPTADELRRAAAKRLPEYMVPSAIVLLDELPVTANGKLDRAALLAIDLDDDRPVGAVRPARNPVEELIAGIWAEVLRRDGVGVDEDFFELGGHSLLATQAISRLRKVFGVELPLRALFEHPTPAALARRVEDRLEGEGTAAAPPLVASGRAGDLPLSFSQQRLWFIDQLDPGSAAQNIAAAVELEGPLGVGAFAAALTGVVARHEVLRTTFAASADGETPVQVVHPARAVATPVIDLSAVLPGGRADAARRLARREALRPFDLAAGPVLRVTLLRLAPERHVVLFTMHHIAGDGWSMSLLVQELEALYRAALDGRPATLAPLPLQYADYAVWQRTWLRGEALRQRLELVRRRLEGAPQAVELPTDRPRPTHLGTRGGSVPFRIPEELDRALRELGRREGVTPFMLLLAAFAVLLSRYSGQHDLVVGSPVAGRNRVETERLIGLFVNTLLLRVAIDEDADVSGLLRAVRESAFEGHRHQDLPFEKLVEELQPERSLARSPLFNVLFALENHPGRTSRFGNTTVRPAGGEQETITFDLVLEVADQETAFAGKLRFNRHLFDPVTVRRMADHYRTLLAAVAGAPGTPVAELPLLGAGERHQVLVEWDASRDDEWHEVPVHRLAERQAAARPDAVAVQMDAVCWSYGHLRRTAGAWAGALRELGAAPGRRVAVLQRTRPERVAALLAVLEAGAAFCCLDPDLPDARLRAILEELEPALLLAEEATTGLGAGLAEGTGVRLAILERLAGGGRCGPEDYDLGRPLYVVYTSGSTGRPKGIVQSHRAFSQFLEWQAREAGIGPGSRVASWASITYDASLCEVFGALGFGAVSCLAGKETRFDPLPLRRWLERERVTLFQTVPSFARQLVRDLDPAPARSLPALETLLLAGEVLPSDLARAWRERLGTRCRIYNLYGPTESVLATHHRVGATAPERGAVPVGRAIAGRQALVLDPRGRVCPIGVPGEIHVRGGFLTDGYWRRPGQTAAAFVPDPRPAAAGDRAYRTGDLGAWRNDGALAFRGRRDHQVKLRGMRVELEEVEAVLAEEAQVADCAAAVRDRGEGDQRLVAYVVLAAPGGAEGGRAAALEREHLDRFEGIYDEIYGMEEAYSPRDPGINLRSWTSSYTGGALPEAEILESVEDTARRVLALAPERTLEVGCGSGLILSRVAPRCRSYTGVDVSRKALDYLQGILDEGPGEAAVRLLHGSADALDGVPDGAFDTVVSNLVVQHFPSAEYLLAVVDELVRKTAPEGSIFFGGVRSLPLLETFHASVQLARARPDEPSHAVWERVGTQLRAEKDLVVDAAFFAALPRRVPRIGRVTVLLKSERPDNEITRFQYDVILELDREPEPEPEAPWLDWRAGGLTEEALRSRLESAPRAAGPTLLRVASVPNARLVGETLVRELLSASDGRPATAGDLRRLAAARAPRGVHPSDLHAMAAGLGLEASCGPSYEPDRFDVVFRRPGAARGVPFRHPRPPAPEAPWSRLVHAPLSGLAAGRAEAALRALAARRLPEHMRPSSYVFLPSLPRTRTAKIDRRSLPAPEDRRGGGGESLREPRTGVERRLAELWKELLRVDRVGLDDSFFALGGHSLLATRLVNRLRRVFGAEVPLHALFERPTLAALAERLEGTAAPAGGGAIPRVPRGAPSYPASHSQQRLWFLQALEPGSAAYNMFAPLRLRGAADLYALGRALRALVSRHTALRTTFACDQEGEVVQVVADRAPAPLPVIDLGALPEPARAGEARRRATGEAERPFDLGRGPLVRFRLLRLALDDHVLLAALHHIVSDGWSMQVLARELSVLYEAFSAGRPSPLPAPGVDYVDFAAWKREELRGGKLEAQLAYWRRRLAGAPTLALPTDRPRPEVPSRRGGRVPFALPPALAAGLRCLAEAEGATLFMTLLGAYKVFLGRTAGQEDVVVGISVANRDRTELEGVIGFFANQLALRTRVDRRGGFRQALAAVRRTVLAAFEHQDLPFQELVATLRPDRRPGENPLFQATFGFETLDRSDAFGLRGLDVGFGAADLGVASFDLALRMTETGGRLAGEIEYDADLFDEATVVGMADRFRTLLAGLVAEPDVPVSSISMVSSEERAQRKAQAFDRLRRIRPTTVPSQVREDG